MVPPVLEEARLEEEVARLDALFGHEVERELRGPAREREGADPELELGVRPAREPLDRLGHLRLDDLLDPGPLHVLELDERVAETHPRARREVPESLLDVVVREVAALDETVPERLVGLRAGRLDDRAAAEREERLLPVSPVEEERARLPADLEHLDDVRERNVLQPAREGVLDDRFGDAHGRASPPSASLRRSSATGFSK